MVTKSPQSAGLSSMALVGHATVTESMVKHYCRFVYASCSQQMITGYICSVNFLLPKVIRGWIGIFW